MENINFARLAGNLRGIADGLEASPRHDFGGHQKCLILSESWAKDFFDKLRAAADAIDPPPSSP